MCFAFNLDEATLETITVYLRHMRMHTHTRMHTHMHIHTQNQVHIVLFSMDHFMILKSDLEITLESTMATWPFMPNAYGFTCGLLHKPNRLHIALFLPYGLFTLQVGLFLFNNTNSMHEQSL